MIAVIADDFTGAAEIGGIGLRHGLSVVIETHPVQTNEVDLLIIATDTRSMDPDNAADHIRHITRELVRFYPQIIYKKTDSVLRGNITHELIAQMEVSGKSRCILIPANPVFDRFIRDGKYYIGNTPLHKTHFAIDIQYPIHSSDVLSILSRIKNYELFSRKANEELPEKGLIVGDVLELQDLSKWVSHYDQNTLLAGASGFFNSLLINLNIKNIPLNNYHVPFGKHALFVMGSRYPKNEDTLHRMAENGLYFSDMPEEMYYMDDFNGKLMPEWADDIVHAIQNFNKVILSVSHSPGKQTGIEHRIKKLVARVVGEVFNRITINELVIEGGSTTSEILKSLEINRLTPFHEVEPGVIRMKVDSRPELYLTTKPGSYPWPEKVWLKEEIERFNTAI